MLVSRKKSFIKSYQVLPRKIQDKTDEVLLLFEKNPLDEALRNHKLFKERLGHRSIDVTGDYRIIFKELSNGRYEFVEFVEVGTHSQLYG